MDVLAQHIEALIFSAEQPLAIKDLKACLESVYADRVPSTAEIQNTLQTLLQKYQADHFSFELIQIADGYQFLTKPQYYPVVNSLLKHRNRKKLSTAAVETLAIIAYKQPLSKTDVEHIRGVNCDYTIQKLLEKELIAISGRSPAPGRPLLYATTPKFMEHFGITSVADLPKLKDFNHTDNTIGNETPIEMQHSS
jgi:segregation and condensation protein B